LIKDDTALLLTMNKKLDVITERMEGLRIPRSEPKQGSTGGSRERFKGWILAAALDRALTPRVRLVEDEKLDGYWQARRKEQLTRALL